MVLPSKGAPWLTGVIGIAIGIEIAIGGCRRHGAGNWRLREEYSITPTPDSDTDFDERRVLHQHSVTGVS